MLKIGVLALQGAFIEHEKMLAELGASAFEIRQKKDWLQSMDGLILPGGESTVMGKLLQELELFSSIKEEIEKGLPVFGTCAGLILLAKKLSNDQKTPTLGTMDITVERNAYGRQMGSFFTTAEFAGLGKIPMTFIRAPYITQVHNNAEVLAVVEDRIVAAKENNQLATAFHPELGTDCSVHEYFLKMIR